jgi:hypothetical protein
MDSGDRIRLMTIAFEERKSDSPYVQTVTRGRTLSDGAPTRPAEIHWHMVFSRRQGRMIPLLVGPWSASGMITYEADCDLLWIRLKLGAYLPHLPTQKFRNSETVLPDASSRAFWLRGSAWEFPDFENADTFVDHLMRDGALAFDPAVADALEDRPPDISARTMRHRFLHVTGHSQAHIRQYERAQQAAALLARGASILDTVHEAGYYDQPHLTRSLTKFVGYTPARHKVLMGAPQ